MENYAILVRLDGRDHFAVWRGNSDDGTPDQILMRDGVAIWFDTTEALDRWLAGAGSSREPGDPIVYDLDHLQRQIFLSTERPDPSEVLNVWNLCADYCAAAPLDCPSVDEFARLHEKLFLASMPDDLLTAARSAALTDWSPEEIADIEHIARQCVDAIRALMPSRALAGAPVR